MFSPQHNLGMSLELEILATIGVTEKEAKLRVRFAMINFCAPAVKLTQSSLKAAGRCLPASTELLSMAAFHQTYV